MYLKETNNVNTKILLRRYFNIYLFVYERTIDASNNNKVLIIIIIIIIIIIVLGRYWRKNGF
tara:strand:+ start:59 stop:244 length:186 start_codon:yes stop_codon:yes gene_type:complete